MVRSRLVAAWMCAAAVILSAPYAQQLFTYVDMRWPARSRTLGIAATVVPASIVCLLALWRIRDRRTSRYAAAVAAVVVGLTTVSWMALTFAEAFHFVEYGALAMLFYRAWAGAGDRSVFALPLLAGLIAGSLDEWFQWFIPIRAGEARDVLLDLVAAACGVLAGFAIEPPPPLKARLDRRSRSAVLTHAAVAVAAFAGLFYAVHVGHDVRDPEVGLFPSRYTAGQLEAAARDRASRWQTAPPVLQRRFGREDHYLTEALWHVRQRNEAWNAGDAATAWRENRILEKFYAPVLETPTYANAAGHRWPPAQRADAAARAAGVRPSASRAYAYPLFIWPDRF